jgi:PPP family 3-phenylpropionic acid transporter
VPISALNKIRTQVAGAPFVARLAAFNAATFFVIGVHLPYMPLWLNSKGLSDVEIGVIMAAPQMVRVGLTPLISFLADSLGDFRAMLRLLCLGTCLALLALAFSGSFAEILACFFCYAVSWTTIIPLTEAIAMKGVREGGHNYGRMRLWGSLSFIVASAACGAGIQYWGASTVIAFIIAAAFCLLAASAVLPEARSAPPVGAGPQAKRLNEALDVLGAPAFWAFIAAASMTQAAHGLYYTFATIHWRAQHYPGVAIGALWALGVIAEIVLFACSGRLLAHVRPSRLILLGAAASALRWAAMAAEPPLVLLFPLQTLHAFTFGASHLGAVHFISETVPERHAATAQGLYAAVSGGAMGLTTLASGRLYHAWGASGFWLMALLGVLAAASALRLDRLWRRDALTVKAG